MAKPTAVTKPTAAQATAQANSWGTQSWQTDSPLFTIDDPISNLTKLAPYKKSEDKKGHSSPLQAWFPKDMMRRVSKIKESGPYTTNGDVARDAMWIGMMVLELRYNSDPEWILFQQLTRLNNDALWMAAMFEEEDEFVDQLDSFCANKEEDTAVEMLVGRFNLLVGSGNQKRKDALVDSLRKHRLSHLLEKCKVS